MHENLAVGLDLLAIEYDQVHLEGYSALLERLLARVEEVMGREDILSRLRANVFGDGLTCSLKPE